MAGDFNAEMMALITRIPITQGWWSDQIVWSPTKSVVVASRDMLQLLYLIRAAYPFSTDLETGNSNES